MKIINHILITALIITGLASCKDDFGETDFINSVAAPTNVSAIFDVTQDNSGNVTITPTASGVSSYQIYFGDETAEPSEVKAGNSIAHTYKEGTYQVRIIAQNTVGKTTESTLPLEVSFKAPENLEVTITNDQAISKKITVTATADFAISYDVYFGEDANETPVSVNIKESVSYTYKQTGTYTVKIVAKGAGKQTTSYEKSIEAIALQQPTTSATKPPLRDAKEVISIFSDAYTNLAGTNFNPDWGQGGLGSSFADFSLENDAMLQYIKLSYQGIEFAETDLSSMEYLHLDVWTADLSSMQIFLISKATGEKFVTKNLTADGWTSIDIPLTDFTNQGMGISDIFQFKFDTETRSKGTIFVDNMYFYKKSAGGNKLLIQDFEKAAPTFTSFGNIATDEVVANPNTMGNASDKVAKQTQTAGAETWAGTFFSSSDLDLKTYKTIKMKVLSPKANVPVLVKLENADASVVYEVQATATNSNTWEELSFDFSKVPSATFTKVVVFFDFGNTGDGSVYYYDDIILTN